MSARAIFRAMVAGWLFQVKNMTISGFFLLTAVVQPIIFASLAFFLFEAGGQSGTLLYAALGAGMMGIWSSTLFGSGGAIQGQRWLGTLELLVITPPPFIVVLLPLTLATSTIGIYSVAATLLWGRVLFDVPLHLVHPFMFAIALPSAIIGLGLLGLVMAATFVLYRNANAMSNLLEYPVWLATGLLVPVALLPGWVLPISWILAPTWGMRALRESAMGGGSPLSAIAMCWLLGACYLALGAVFIAHFERLARARATLSLT